MSDDHSEPAHNEVGEVRPCKCGGANVKIGRTTIHLKPEEVDAFYELAAAAQELVAAATPARGEPKKKSKSKSRFH